MTTDLETIPTTANFNPLIRPYLVITIGLTLATTIIGLPLALVWFFGVGQWWARHYFDKLECNIGEKTLRYRKGILFQVEKTIPLENIQDVTFIEGPLLRHFHLSTLKFETAGNSAGQADTQLTGIIDAHDFRNKILDSRDRLKEKTNRSYQLQQAPNNNNDALAANQIALLQAIERHLAEITQLLKERK